MNASSGAVVNWLSMQTHNACIVSLNSAWHDKNTTSEKGNMGDNLIKTHVPCKTMEA